MKETKLVPLIEAIAESVDSIAGSRDGSDYKPPYDSPIEDLFAWHCQKHLSTNVRFDSQVNVQTQHGLLRIDFVLDGRVAVECDGRDFHEDLRDEIRDAVLLGEGHFKTVYHFRGCDITYHPDDCIWLMSKLNPELFSERGRLHLERLHKVEIGEKADFADRESFSFRGRDSLFWAFRRTVNLRSSYEHWPHWKCLYNFAKEHPGQSVDDLYSMRTAAWGKTEDPESSAES